MALGIGATLLGYADLVLMSAEARVRCPFTDLAVAPEAASSYLFPLMLGRQQATWLLMSSEWFSAEECADMGLAWRLVEPDALLATTLDVAQRLASKSIASLVETKRTIIAAHRDAIVAARAREDHAFARLLGGPANLEAFVAFGERRPPDFAGVDAAHPVDTELHRAD
jgi:enoyl-CoA hydratase/carnithine racemase